MWARIATLWTTDMAPEKGPFKEDAVYRHPLAGSMWIFRSLAPKALITPALPYNNREPAFQDIINIPSLPILGELTGFETPLSSWGYLPTLLQGKPCIRMATRNPQARPNLMYRLK